MAKKNKTIKKKKEKRGWAKWVNRDDAYKIGKLVGTRRTLEILAEEYAFDEGMVAWLFEKHITKNKNWKGNLPKKFCPQKLKA